MAELSKLDCEACGEKFKDEALAKTHLKEHTTVQHLFGGTLQNVYGLTSTMLINNTVGLESVNVWNEFMRGQRLQPHYDYSVNWKYRTTSQKMCALIRHRDFIQLVHTVNIFEKDLLISKTHYYKATKALLWTTSQENVPYDPLTSYESISLAIGDDRAAKKAHAAVSKQMLNRTSPQPSLKD